MHKRIIIDINLTSSTGHPLQLHQKLKDIVDDLRWKVHIEEQDRFNAVVYDGYRKPHACELTIDFKEVEGEE